MITTYSNMMTVVFEGIETDSNGKQKVVRRNTTMSDADTWPELLQEFVHSLRGAGYYPNLDTAVEAIQELFPSTDEEFGWCLDEEEESVCGNCENNPANYSS